MQKKECVVNVNIGADAQVDVYVDVVWCSCVPLN